MFPPFLTDGPQTSPGADENSASKEIVLQGQTVEAPAVGRRVNPLQTGAFREEAELARQGHLRDFRHQIPKSVTGPDPNRQGFFSRDADFRGFSADRESGTGRSDPGGPSCQAVVLDLSTTSA